MSYQSERRRRRYVYYVPEEETVPNEREEIVPIPIKRKENGLVREYQEKPQPLFPILRMILDLIREAIQARLLLLRQRYGYVEPKTRFPKTLREEIVRDEHGRVIERTYTIIEDE